MAITYTGELTTDLDRVRFYLGDTVNGTGIKPDGSNFTDAELNGLVTLEGSWQRAVAGACEALVMLYAPEVDIAVGPRRESLSQAAARYEKQAESWRKRYGRSTGSVVTGALTRVDGYSDDIAANEL